MLTCVSFHSFQVYEIAKEHNLIIHTDGARILNSAVALGIPVSEILKYSDSVSMCFSKVLVTFHCPFPVFGYFHTELNSDKLQ